MIKSKKSLRFTRICVLDENSACLPGCVKRTHQSQIIVELRVPQALLAVLSCSCRPEPFGNFNLFEPLKPFSPEKSVFNQVLGAFRGELTGDFGESSGRFGRGYGTVRHRGRSLCEWIRGASVFVDPAPAPEPAPGGGVAVGGWPGRARDLQGQGALTVLGPPRPAGRIRCCAWLRSSAAECGRVRSAAVR